jgi:hypothetical protein
LNEPAVADDENAVIPLRKAAGAMNTAGPLWKRFEALNVSAPLTPVESETISAMVADHAQTLAWVRAARRKPRIDWGLSFTSPVLMMLLKDATPQRQMANLLRAAIYDAHRRGDHRAAVEYARDTLFVGRAMRRQPLLISTLISTGIEGVAVECLQKITPALRVEPDGGADGLAVDPEQLRALIAELLDEEPQRQATLSALKSERLSQLDTVLSIVHGRVPLTALAPGATPRFGRGTALYRMRPMMIGDAILMIDHMTAVIDAASRAATWPAYRKLAPKAIDDSVRGSFRHIMVALLLPSTDRFLQNRYEHATRRRLTAAALAIRWHAAEHGGRLPATLEELAPRYLPSVPADVMAESGPIRHVAEGADPRVYSVGENGVDDGGDGEIDPKKRGSRRPPDIVVHLTLRPRTGDDAPTPEGDLPPMPSATQPAAD